MTVNEAIAALQNVKRLVERADRYAQHVAEEMDDPDLTAAELLALKDRLKKHLNAIRLEVIAIRDGLV